MPHLKLALFGQFQTTLDGSVIQSFESDKVRALLIFLALEATHTHSRTRLATLLWSGYEEQSARSNLRQALYQLRQVIGDDVADPPFLVITRQTIQFNPLAHYTLDVTTFCQLIEESARHVHSSLDPCDACLARLTQAAALYQGDLLAGFTVVDSDEFEEWRRIQQEQLHLQAIDLFHQLASAYEVRNEEAAVQRYARRLLQLEPWREETHRQLMRLFARQGQRTAALAQYQSCRQALQQEFGVEPEEATLHLYEQIYAGKFGKESARSKVEGERLASSPRSAETAASSVESLSRVVEQLPSEPFLSPLSPLYDWGEMPAVDFFAGRDEEMAQLQTWLTPEAAANAAPTRLITLLGLGGMGKTTLAAAVTKSIAPAYDVVIWRSLLNAPPLMELLGNWLQLLSRQQLKSVPTALDRQLRLLLHYLRQERCLLVLDNVESIFEAGNAAKHAGATRAGYEGYDPLFQQVGGGDHLSCLLLTSREQPYALLRLLHQSQLTGGRVRVLPLAGLDMAAGQLLIQSSGLAAPAQTVEQLVYNYSGNPLALQIVAATINDFFAGDIANFLQAEGKLFDGIRAVLDQQFARLSALERDILVWLAIEREAIPVATLRSNLLQTHLDAFASDGELLEALHSLQQRALIEKIGNGLTLQNVIIEYTTNYLVEQMCQEILDLRSWIPNSSADEAQAKIAASCFNRFALMKAQAKEYVRQSQVRLMVQPVADRLQARWGKAALPAAIADLLSKVRVAPPLTPGYAAGNLLTLLRHWRIDHTGYDFSQLCVWAVDFRGARFAEINFAGADLSFCTFTLTIKGFALKLRADQELLVGDLAQGDVIVWALTGEQSLASYHHWRSNGGFPMVFNQANRVAPLFLAGAGLDFAIRVWSVDEHKLYHVFTGHRDPISALAINDRGTYLASGSEDQIICLWDLRSGRLVQTLRGHSGAISALAFAPVPEDQDPNTAAITLFSSSRDKTLCRWDIQQDQSVTTWRVQVDEGFALAVTSDCSLVASGHMDGTIQLWSATTGERISTLKGHSNRVNVLAFHSQPSERAEGGHWLASGGSDHTVLLWDVQQKGLHQLMHRLVGHEDGVYHLSFSPEGRHFASASAERTIRLWDTTTGRPLKVLTGHIDVVRTVQFSPDGRLVASGGGDGIVRLWEIGAIGQNQNNSTAQTSATVVRYLAGHSQQVLAVAFSPDGTLLASASADHTIALWDVQSGQLLQTLFAHNAPVTSLAFHPTQSLLASGSVDHTIRLWVRQTDASWAEAENSSGFGHQASVTALAFHPAGHTLISGGEDHNLSFWDVESRAQRALLVGHTAGVTSVAIPANGQQVASSSGDYTMRLWRADSGDPLLVRSGDRLGGHSVAIAADSELMAYGAEEVAIEVWNLRTQQVVHTLRGHTSTVLTLAFNPVAPLLISGGWDGTLRLWHLETGQCLQTLRAPGPYAGMNIVGVTGISQAQKESLKALGAVEEDASSTIQAQAGQVRTTTRIDPDPIPPLATPHNLPAQSTPFVGRVDDLAKLLTLLSQPDQRLLTLLGPGGMGKTRLAIEVAQQIVSSSPISNLHFPDGVFFVSLAPLTSLDSLAPAIVSTIDMDLRGAEPQQTLLKFLQSKQLLLILDNFEHLLEGAGMVAELIQGAPRLRIIVTSRARLNLHSETVHQVRPLALSKAASLASAMGSDSVRLFVQCAERSNRSFAVNESNLSAVLHICQLVEGMPLGLEMAAAWSEWLSVNEIAKEIEKSSDFLSVDWPDAPARQRSMRAVFEWSWKLLNEHEQQVFRSLSIFRGGFARAAAEQVADASLRTLVSLANKSFLNVSHAQGDAAPRYHIHELLRQFAAEELRISGGIQTTSQRHSDYYLDFLTVREEQMFRQSGGAIAELQGEWDNIYQAWTWAAQQKNLGELGRSIYTLAQYCHIAGLATQAVQLFQLAAQSLQGEKEGSEPKQEDVGKRKYVLSSIYSLQSEALVMLSRYKEGEEFARRGIVWGKASGNHHAEVLGHFTLAKLLGTQGHYREAQQGMLQTFELLQDYQQKNEGAGKLLEAELSIMLWLGHLAMMCDQFQEAKTRFRAGLHLSQSMTRKRAEVSFLLNLADLLVHRFGDYAIAKEHYQDALRISRDLGFRWGEGSALLEFGDLLRFQGKYTHALDFYSRALLIFETIHHPSKAIYSEMSIGLLFCYVGEYERSHLIFARLANLLETLPEDSIKPNLLLAFATRNYHLQHYEQALGSIEGGLRLLDQFGSIALRIAYFTIAGHCQANLNQKEMAASSYQQALALCNNLEFSAPAAEAHAGLARLAFEQGNLTVSLHEVEQILAILQKFPYAGIGEPFFIYLTCHQILTVLHDPRAEAILHKGKEVLHHYASHIDDESRRRSFLENVPIHWQLYRL